MPRLCDMHWHCFLPECSYLRAEPDMPQRGDLRPHLTDMRVLADLQPVRLDLRWMADLQRHTKLLWAAYMWHPADLC